MSFSYSKSYSSENWTASNLTTFQAELKRQSSGNNNHAGEATNYRVRGQFEWADSRDKDRELAKTHLMNRREGGTMRGIEFEMRHYYILKCLK